MVSQTGYRSVTGAIEQALVDRIRVYFGPILRTVETIPADLSASELRTRLRVVPGAFVSFAGGGQRDVRGTSIDGRFTVFVCVGGGLKEEQRRTGTQGVIGAYEAAELIAVLLCDKPLTIADLETTVSSPRLVSLDRVQSDELAKENFTIYALVISIQYGFGSLPAADALTDFRVFGGQIDLDHTIKSDGKPDPVLPVDPALVASTDTVFLETA